MGEYYFCSEFSWLCRLGIAPTLSDERALWRLHKLSCFVLALVELLVMITYKYKPVCHFYLCVHSASIICCCRSCILFGRPSIPTVADSSPHDLTVREQMSLALQNK